MLARYCSYGRVSVCLSACLSGVGVLSKLVDGSSWFLPWRLDPSTYRTLCHKDIRMSPKLQIRYFPLELGHELWNYTKLSYRRGTARRAVSVGTVRNVAKNTLTAWMAARCKLQRPGYTPVCISAGRPLNPAANNRPHYADCSARTNLTIVVWSSLMAVIHGPLTGEIRWQE